MARKYFSLHPISSKQHWGYCICKGKKNIKILHGELASFLPPPLQHCITDQGGSLTEWRQRCCLTDGGKIRSSWKICLIWERGGMRRTPEVPSTLEFSPIIQLATVTRTGAAVNERSEAQEGAAGWAWHLGQDEGAGKRGLTPSLLPRQGWEMGTVLEGQDQPSTLGGREDWQKKLCQAEKPCLQSLEGFPAAPSCSTHLQGAGEEVPPSPPGWPRASRQPLQVVHARGAAWWLIGFFTRVLLWGTTTESNSSPSQQEMLGQEKQGEKTNYRTAWLREHRSALASSWAKPASIHLLMPVGSCFTLTVSGPILRAKQTQGTWPLPAQKDGPCRPPASTKISMPSSS